MIELWNIAVTSPIVFILIIILALFIVFIIITATMPFIKKIFPHRCNGCGKWFRYKQLNFFEEFTSEKCYSCNGTGTDLHLDIAHKAPTTCLSCNGAGFHTTKIIYPPEILNRLGELPKQYCNSCEEAIMRK